MGVKKVKVLCYIEIEDDEGESVIKGPLQSECKAWTREEPEIFLQEVRRVASGHFKTWLELALSDPNCPILSVKENLK